MQPFSNRELYIMNGGNKLYIYKDGFGDVYHATPAEEAEWAKEVIASALVKIDTSENSVELNSAIENLRFHKYEGLGALIQSKFKKTSPAWRAVLETITSHADIYSVSEEEKHVQMIYQDLVQHGNDRMNDVFSRFGNFKNNAAKLFMLTCVEGDDDALFIQATITLGRWAYSGLPLLRQNRLLEILQPENRDLPTFRPAVEQLKYILQKN